MTTSPRPFAAQAPSVASVWSMVWAQNGTHPQLTSAATILRFGFRSNTPSKIR